MFHKVPGQQTELLLRSLFASLGLPSCYLLVARDGDSFVGFLYASFIALGEPFVEVHAIWSLPGYATKIKQDVHKMLVEWAAGMGATKITASVIRSYKTFFKFFHEPLGYKVKGYIVELEV